MAIVVGYAPNDRGRAALHLARMLARSLDDALVVCSVIPAPWVPGMARIDAEYQEFLEQTADKALEHAGSILGSAVPATYVRHHARSAPAGLLEVADQHAARMVVLGSSSGGVFGHVALGSVTDRLLHSSHIPIALATRGFRCKPDAGLVRVTAACGETEGSSDLIVAAAGVSARVGAVLRIASFAVWSRPDYTTRLGTDPEDDIYKEWLAMLEQTAHTALEQVGELPKVPRAVESVVGQGETWAEAMDDVGWDAGDVLVVGSSADGPVSRVFLGSRSSKIVRSSPVPVLVVPRQRVVELADQATHG
jgi:nucleotide-binding universal stress UspA family protein